MDPRERERERERLNNKILSDLLIFTESGDGYYHNRESENEENSKKVNKQSYRKKESKGFRLGNGGFKKKKTEFSESLKTSESEQQSSSNKEVEEGKIS